MLEAFKAYRTRRVGRFSTLHPCRSLTAFQLPYPQEPPYVPMVLPTEGPMECPLPGYSRNPFEERPVEGGQVLDASTLRAAFAKLDTDASGLLSLSLSLSLSGLPPSRVSVAALPLPLPLSLTQTL